METVESGSRILTFNDVNDIVMLSNAPKKVWNFRSTFFNWWWQISYIRFPLFKSVQ